MISDLYILVWNIVLVVSFFFKLKENISKTNRQSEINPYLSVGMTSSLDCSSISTVRSVGGELEYDLWEGQFTFTQPGAIPDATVGVVNFFKTEYHTLVSKVQTFYGFSFISF